MMHWSQVGRNILLALFIYALIHSCKPAETVSEMRLRPMSPGRLIRNIEENAFDYSSFNVKRINIMMDDGQSKNSFRATMQAIKDRQILLTVSKFNIPLGRLSLTPDSILFVNYMERTYITDGYSALSDLLNFDLDFYAVQAILSGNIFSFFEDEDELKSYNSYVSDGMYMIQSETMRKLRKIDEKGKVQKAERIIRKNDDESLVVNTFFFDPKLFVMKRMVLEDKTWSRNLNLQFDEYQKVDQKYYPGSIMLTLNNGGEAVRLELSMSGFSTEHSELLPVRLPDKYQRVYIN
jgi:hypothetical protein